MFSSRLPRDLTPNRLAVAIAAHRASGRELFDLTATNPTSAGIEYAADVLAPLADRAGRAYRPEPFGLRSAREAVARDYARLGTSVAVDRIVLTASTSEAYSLLFKLLCDPGDGVLIPAPSYPLFDHLCALDGVRGPHYRLEYHGRWSIDADSLAAAWTDDVRAVLAVDPNNPTASYLSNEDFELLTSSCAGRGAALILDEVFADYPLAESLPREGGSHRNTNVILPPEGGSHATKKDSPPALTFRLGGLSKSAGLPQVKLGWIAIDGPAALVNEAQTRLEIICDTYLSVSTPVQVAASALIESGAAARRQILARIRRNHAHLAAAVASAPSIELLRADAGWSAVLRIPSTRSEEDVVLDLLEHHAVLVHPGYFFDFPHEAFLVVSLLPPADVFDEAIARVAKNIHG